MQRVRGGFIADTQDFWREQGKKPDGQSARDRKYPDRNSHPFAPLPQPGRRKDGAAIEDDGQSCGSDAEKRGCGEVPDAGRDHFVEPEYRILTEVMPDDQCADDGRGRDRCHRTQGVVAQDDLESEEGPGNRRIEAGRDRSGGTAGQEDAAAAGRHAQCLPDGRGKRGAQMDRRPFATGAGAATQGNRGHDSRVEAGTQADAACIDRARLDDVRHALAARIGGQFPALAQPEHDGDQPASSKRDQQEAPGRQMRRGRCQVNFGDAEGRAFDSGYAQAQ